MIRSRAERTEYRETSSFEDVCAFLDALAKEAPALHRESFGRTNEGRDLPLAVVSEPRVSTPEEARALGRPIAFVMANIHAGEVEGKEAAQHLLRRLLRGDLRPLARRLVVLVAPIYNADGNERLGPQATNRPEQNGPESVGVRPNAQGLDLNRDYMKLESPEARGLVAGVFGRWDPHLTIDCHATDGSFHGFALTWAPPLHPGGRAGPIAYLKERFLPAVSARMDRRGTRTFPYGNFDDPRRPEAGWSTYDHRPRFGNNYLALRNRPCVLSEAYSHEPFRRRVESTEAFLVANLETLAEEGERILAVCEEADRETARLARPGGGDATVAVGFEFAPPRTGRIPARETPLGTDRWVEAPVRDAFRVSRCVPRPRAWLLEPSLVPVVALLRLHGIPVLPLAGPRRIASAVSHRLTARSRAAEEFQGHRATTVSVERVRRHMDAAMGWHLVPLDHPLGDLACQLLEPEADDGAVAWNLLDPALDRLLPGAPDAFLPIHAIFGHEDIPK